MIKNFKHKMLSISLFSPISGWQILLKDGIIPFFCFLKDRLISYRVQFNYDCGPNIRLSLYVHSGNAMDVAKEADLFFKVFFQELEKPTDSEPLKFDGLFMPFPSNSIRYGLFEVAGMEKMEPLEKAFSVLVLNGLSDEVIDEEAVLTFCIYVSFLNYKAVKQRGMKACVEWSGFYHQQDLLYRDIEPDYSAITAKQAELATALGNYYIEIDSDMEEGLPECFRTWNQVFKKSLDEGLEPDKLLKLFQMINYYFLRYFSLNSFSVALLNKLILETLSKIYHAEKL